MVTVFGTKVLACATPYVAESWGVAEAGRHLALSEPGMVLRCSDSNYYFFFFILLPEESNCNLEDDQ